MGFVVLCGAAIMGLHAYIVNKFPQQRVPTEMVAKAQRLAQRRRRQQAEQQRQSLAASDVAPSSAGPLSFELWLTSTCMVSRQEGSTAATHITTINWRQWDLHLGM